MLSDSRGRRSDGGEQVKEGDMGVYVIAVLSFFSSGISRYAIFHPTPPPNVPLVKGLRSLFFAGRGGGGFFWGDHLTFRRTKGGISRNNCSFFLREFFSRALLHDCPEQVMAFYLFFSVVDKATEDKRDSSPATDLLFFLSFYHPACFEHVTPNPPSQILIFLPVWG